MESGLESNLAVERDGEVRTMHVANATGATLRPAIVKAVSRKSCIMTGESPVYPKIGAEFAGHGTVNHSAEEYIRAAIQYTNTVVNYFSLLKRGITGDYRCVSPTHLHPCCAEFDFRYNAGKQTNAGRATLMIAGAEGRHPTYRRADEGVSALAS